MRSSVRISIDNSRLDVLDIIYRAHLRSSDVKILDDRIILSIDRVDLMHLTRILNRSGIEWKVVKEPIFTHIYHTLASRVGLVIGIIACIIISIVLGNMTLDISVKGDNITPYHMIEDTLDDLNIHKYQRKLNSLDTLEDKLLSNCPNISFVDARYEGGLLRIDIKESLVPKALNKDVDGNIIANYDGIITKMIVTSGTPSVKVGDSVKRGDVLIYAHTTIGDYEDAQQVSAKAEGEIYATCYMQEDVVLGKENISFVTSGNKKVYHRLYSQDVPRIPYEHYILTKEERRLMGILPLKYTTYTYHERIMKVRSFDDVKYRESLILGAKNKLNLRLNACDKVERDWIFEKRLDNLYIISVYYEVEKLISGGKLE